MLETVREFALEHLLASGAADAVRDRHAAHFLSLVERVSHAVFPFYWAGDAHTGALPLDPITANRQVEPEQDNVRAALDWLVEHGQTEASLRLTAACVLFWHSWGQLREAQMRLDQALAMAGPEPTGFSVKPETTGSMAATARIS